MRKLFKGRSTERDAFRIPRSVQQSIPIKRIYKDGVFQVSGRFSKTWRFFDINSVKFNYFCLRLITKI